MDLRDQAGAARAAPSEARQTGLNIAANAGTFLLQALISLWFTRFLIRNLSVAVYGLFPLATSLASYLVVVTTAIQGGVGRYLTIAIRRGRNAEADSIFNTSLWSMMAVGAVLLPAIIVFSVHVPHLFNVPPGNDESARIFFFCALLTYLLALIRGVFSCSCVAANRVDLQNASFAVELIVRTGVVVALFSLWSRSLASVGLAMVLAGVAALAAGIFIWRRLTPQLSVNARCVSLERLREMTSMGGWLAVNQIGNIIFLSIDVMVVNLVLGSTVAGRYGTVLLWATFVRGAAATMSTVISPVAFRQYAGGDMNALHATIRSSVRMMGCALAIPVGILCGLAKPLLSVWLGRDFAGLWPLMVVCLGHLVIDLSVLPLLSANVTVNRVRLPGLFTLGSGVANVVLAFACARLQRDGIGVAAAGAAVLIIKNCVFLPLYTARVQKLPGRTYILAVIPGVIVAGLLFGAGALISAAFLSAPTLLGLVASACALGAAAFAVIWIILEPSERWLLVSMFPLLSLPAPSRARAK